jgi:hypothetical protein
MPRIVPNPIGDLKHPLQRIEDAITSLSKRLHPVETLPSVREELEQVNRALTSILIVLEEIRDQQGATAVKRPAA